MADCSNQDIDTNLTETKRINSNALIMCKYSNKHITPKLLDFNENCGIKWKWKCQFQFQFQFTSMHINEFIYSILWHRIALSFSIFDASTQSHRVSLAIETVYAATSMVFEFWFKCFECEFLCSKKRLSNSLVFKKVFSFDFEKNLLSKSSL